MSDETGQWIMAHMTSLLKRYDFMSGEKAKYKMRNPKLFAIALAIFWLIIFFVIQFVTIYQRA